MSAEYMNLNQLIERLVEFRDGVIGFVFELSINGVPEQHRNVKCYSQGNGMYTERDVVEVFNFIQSNSLAWCQI